MNNAQKPLSDKHETFRVRKSSAKWKAKQRGFGDNLMPDDDFSNFRSVVDWTPPKEEARAEDAGFQHIGIGLYQAIDNAAHAFVVAGEGGKPDRGTVRWISRWYPSSQAGRGRD
jgi:hypothetical protein